MKAINLTGVEEMSTGNGNRIPAGGYTARIIDVVDDPSKEYLTISYDILEGEYANYYSDLVKHFEMSYWPAKYIRSYKDKAKGFFKHFLSCVDKSNGTKYVDQAEFGLNEATMKGKYIGLVLGEEEYESNKGEVKTRLYVAKELPVEDIRNADYKVPEPKKLTKAQAVTGNESWMQVDGNLPTDWN